MEIKNIDFFIIGTQKGGTESALFHLNQHPNIYLPEKEVQYINQPLLYKNDLQNMKKNVEETVSKYVSMYKNRIDLKIKYSNIVKEEKYKDFSNVLFGIKNPEYMYIPKSIELLYNVYPNSKLIIFLREPISRAYSEYNMYLSFTGIKSIFVMPNTFIESITRDDHIKLEDIHVSGYYALQRGYYSTQLKHIYKYFSKSQVKIFISEQVQKEPQKYYKEILEFLNVPLYDLNIDTTIHKGNYKSEMSKEDFLKMYHYYKHYNSELYEMLGYVIEEWEEIYKSYLD